jgi:hypothetical protein
LNIKMLSKKVTKYFMCYPKGLWFNLQKRVSQAFG